MKKMPNGKQVTVEALLKSGQVMTGREYREHYRELSGQGSEKLRVERCVFGQRDPNEEGYPSSK
jgi:hypothetical protein